MKKSLAMLSMISGIIGGSTGYGKKEREFPKNPSVPIPKNCTKWLCDGIELIVLNGKSVEEKFYRKFKYYPTSIQKI